MHKEILLFIEKDILSGSVFYMLEQALGWFLSRFGDWLWKMILRSFHATLPHTRTQAHVG